MTGQPMPHTEPHTLEPSGRLGELCIQSLRIDCAWAPLLLCQSRLYHSSIENQSQSKLKSGLLLTVQCNVSHLFLSPRSGSVTTCPKFCEGTLWQDPVKTLGRHCWKGGSLTLCRTRARYGSSLLVGKFIRSSCSVAASTDPSAAAFSMTVGAADAALLSCWDLCRCSQGAVMLPPLVLLQNARLCAGSDAESEAVAEDLMARQV